MKRNLLKGIFILISAVALSSCSELNQLAKTSNYNDDVYFTKAQAGDTYDYSSMYTQANNNVRNDDYYYYGDYQTRINRFSYYSPFAYDYDFYYDYNPYYYNNYNYGYSFGGLNQAPVYDYAYSPYYDLGVYSAYDFGYGNYWGFDNYGFGNLYSGFIVSGGITKRSRIKTYPSVGGTIGNGSSNSGLAFTRGGAGGSAATALQNGLSFNRGGLTSVYPNARPLASSTVYPGRPNANASVQTAQGNTNRNTTNNQAIRPMTENPRTYTPPPSIERSAPPSQSSGGGSSSGSSSSSGGGGRPVRP